MKIYSIFIMLFLIFVSAIIVTETYMLTEYLVIDKKITQVDSNRLNISALIVILIGHIIIVTKMLYSKEETTI